MNYIYRSSHKLKNYTLIIVSIFRWGGISFNRIHKDNEHIPLKSVMDDLKLTF